VRETTTQANLKCHPIYPSHLTSPTLTYPLPFFFFFSQNSKTGAAIKHLLLMLNPYTNARLTLASPPPPRATVNQSSGTTHPPRATWETSPISAVAVTSWHFFPTKMFAGIGRAPSLYYTKEVFFSVGLLWYLVIVTIFFETKRQVDASEWKNGKFARTYLVSQSAVSFVPLY